MTKVVFILIVLFLFPNSLLAQNNDHPVIEIARLRKKLDKSSNTKDVDVINLYLDIGRAYVKKSLYSNDLKDSASYFFNKAIDYSKTIGLESKLYEGRIGVCEVNYRKYKSVKDLDCFKQVIKHYHELDDKINEGQAWLKMGRVIFESNYGNQMVYHEVLGYFEKAMILFRESNEQLQMAHTSLAISDVYLNQGKLVEAERELVQVLNSYSDLGYDKVHIPYFLLAVTNRLQGDLDSALLYILEAIDNSEKVRESNRLALYLGILGDIHSELEDYKESAIWYQKALDEWEQNMSHEDFNPYRNTYYLIRALIQLGQLEEAMEKLSKIEKVYPPKGIQDQALLVGAKAYIYTAVGDLDKANKNYVAMNTLYEQLQGSSYPIYVSEASIELGNFYFKKGEYAKAKDHLVKALSFPEGVTSLAKRRDIKLLLFKTDSSLGNYLTAIDNFRDFKRISDSIFDVRKSNQIEMLKIKYETDKKQTDIETLTKIQALQENKIGKINTTRNYMIAGLSLLLIILLLLYNSYSIKQKNNRLLISQKNEIHQNNSILQNLLKEKEWLLKEIHHRVKNNLQIVMSLLNTQSYYINNDEALKAIKNSQNRLYAISLIHQNLYKSNDINLINLHSYLSDLVYYLKDSFDMDGSILFNLEADSVFLSEKHALPLGLIANEAISNSIKYAFEQIDKGVIEISLKLLSNNTFCFSVSDNGIGLPKDYDFKNVTSLGLNLIKGLSKQLDGCLEIGNNNGLKIQVVFAIEEPNIALGNKKTA